jgi:hypothetical protein
MPRYISFHSLACLTRQGAEQLTRRMAAANSVRLQRVEVNLVDGKMLVEFEAPTRDELEEWFRSEGFHYEWLMRVELTLREGALAPAT